MTAVLAGAAACSPRFNVSPECSNPDNGHVDPDGTPDACHCEDDAGSVGERAPGWCVNGCPVDFTNCPAAHGGDGGDAGADGPIEGCTGPCAPGAPNGWSDPEVLWIGSEDAAPPCPDDALVIAYEGHADLDAPASCAACSCAPPAGSCALSDPSASPTPFDPPSGWDGSCTTADAIPAGQLCGAEPCVASVLTAPLLLLGETTCAPSVPTSFEPGPWSWGTFARACKAAVPAACGGTGGVCVSSAAGFTACIAHEGDVACPAGYSPYMEKHVFYGGVDDTRSCSACTCGAPAGGACSALVSVYSDAACSALVLADTITSAAASCSDVPAGVALGSKAATPATYLPGACQAGGGVASGAATASMPETFCCLSL